MYMVLLDESYFYSLSYSGTLRECKKWIQSQSEYYHDSYILVKVVSV
jgi:hypothetical protein